MELGRDQIERRDFKTALRGFDQEEVERHLRAIADAVDQLKRAQQPAPQTAGGVTAERVQAIVEAAEASAREIEERARAEAAEHIRSAEAAAKELSLRIAELQRQVGDLIAELESMTAGMPTAAPPPPEPEPEPELAPEPAPKAKSEKRKEDPAAAPKPAAPPAEGARLIALNMALSGTPREETARYLQENFGLENADDLLDDVYARAGS